MAARSTDGDGLSLDDVEQGSRRRPGRTHQGRYRVDTVAGMLVTDLDRFLDLSEDTPGPARRLAEHLSYIVLAATAGDAATAWETALPCRRRPANRRCPGRMIVLRTEPGAPLRWRCSVCDDQGVISNWGDTPLDLRRRGLALAGVVNEIVIPPQVAAALRDLRLLDTDGERLVFRIRAHHHDGADGAVLAAGEDDLDKLIGCVRHRAPGPGVTEPVSQRVPVGTP